MKKRIIPSILLNKGTNVCLSKAFSPWRTVGALTQVLRLHVQRGADELLVINLDSAGKSDKLPSDRILSIVRREVDIPISYAGGIASPESAVHCINSGFDKVFVTSLFIDNPNAVHSISNIIGSQSLGICLPICKIDCCFYVWDFRLGQPSHLPLSQALQLATSCGAGEIFLYDTVSDGSLKGLDHSLCSELLLNSSNIPILLGGGACTPHDFSTSLLHPKIQGIVAGSIFALTDSTPLTIREYCLDSGIAMRRP